MSQCVVPNWNQKQQRQVEGEERNRSPHVQSHQNLRFNNEITELTWENGEISLHGLLPEQTWDEGKPAADSTLESLVHQATTFNFPASQIEQNQDKNMHLVEQCPKEVKVNPPCGEKWRNKNSSDMLGKTSYGEKWRENLSSSTWGKRGRCESGGFHVEESACGSANEALCRDTETTVMTWASFESPRRLKSARTADDDHDCSDREGATKEESYRSQSSARRSRAAATHNLSERRRRDRINQKMKTLQKLVPNASKTDKASMLDEVIEYLKQLQAQVQMMSNARSMPQMMLPLGMQQQLQMSLLASMGMPDVNNLTRNVPHSFPPLIHTTTPVAGTTPAFVSPPFTMPPVVSSLTPPNVDVATVNSSVPNIADTYNTFLAQKSMNMDFLNKMSALYRQQRSASLSLPNDAQGRQ